MKHTILNKHELDIGSFYFYNNYVISEIAEGIAFTYEKAAKLFYLAKGYYGENTPFVYIANRIHSYSFEPTSHFKAYKAFPNMKGYAVITYDSVSHKIASLEKTFLSTPSKIFNNLEDALDWVDELIIPNSVQ